MLKMALPTKIFVGLLADNEVFISHLNVPILIPTEWTLRSKVLLPVIVRGNYISQHCGSKTRRINSINTKARH